MNAVIDEVVTAILAAGPPLAVLDFDGTLSPIVDDPEAAAPVAGAVAALHRLAAAMPVAIVSGRPVADLRRRLPRDLPVALAGGHGAEVAEVDGAVSSLVDLAVVTPVLDGIERELTAALDLDLGWYVERKPTGIAVHHRRVVGDPGAGIDRATAILRAAEATPPGFELGAGKAVLELRVRGVDKGAAVRRLASRWPDRVPFVVGDDVTDEDAFAAAAELGGCTVLVADRARDTRARHRLDDPPAVVRLLEALADRA